MKKDPLQHERIKTSLTIIATFLMGFIDAYTFDERNGTFASAQTGNMIMLGAKLFSGEWQESASHLTVLAGFALGVFGGEAISSKYSFLGLQQYRLFLMTEAVLLLLLACFQSILTDSLMVLFLGILAGYVLTLFRTIRTTGVNNGIMTGNTKNLMNNLYKVLFQKDQQAKEECRNLLIGILLFILGVGAGTLVVKLDARLNLWCAFSIVCLTAIWIEVKWISKMKRLNG
ncbi:YoaK family protein [Sporosarcina sp. Te-1]|uniref:YoaK family protein n=1 Tax=Sporosarcina sp. Te-1 TaxID=2818390 RepID=UPI001A9F7A2A|nr:YoaK family protein [Sporosarcina sp. Te-1]QTD41765.1 DUF1275 domain-containing protein [Sporosarcina sp. Te-1]